MNKFLGKFSTITHVLGGVIVLVTGWLLSDNGVSVLTAVEKSLPAKYAKLLGGLVALLLLYYKSTNAKPETK